MLSAKVGNKSCNRSETCMNNYYVSMIANSYVAIVSHMSVANAGE